MGSFVITTEGQSRADQTSSSEVVYKGIRDTPSLGKKRNKKKSERKSCIEQLNQEVRQCVQLVRSTAGNRFLTRAVQVWMGS